MYIILYLYCAQLRADKIKELNKFVVPYKLLETSRLSFQPIPALQMASNRKLSVFLLAIGLCILFNSATATSKKDDDEIEEEGENEDEEKPTDHEHHHHGDEAPICSLADPDSTKTCISIKFPWLEDSVYFCTDMKNLTYASNCDDTHSFCQNKPAGQNDLKIVTPWDCCPYISKPNKCDEITCPSAPFNRTCTSTKKTHECCSTYFCEKGDAKSCKLKRSKKNCVNPPKRKTNCTSFIDPFGCCNKFQCSGEGKEGDCPTLSKKMHHGVLNNVADRVSKHSPDLASFGMELFKVPVIQRCTGDYTCPGAKKCCPIKTGGIFAAFKAKSSKKGKKEAMKAVHGMCMDPEGTEDSTEDDEGHKSHEHESAEH